MLHIYFFDKMLLSNYLKFLIFLIYIHLASQILIVPYITRVMGMNEYIEYGGHTYTSTIELIKKLFKDRRITNLREVFLYNAGVRKGNLIIPTNLRYCESMMPYIDSRYVSVEVEVTSTNRLYQKLFYCKDKKFYSFEQCLEYSMKYKCHINFHTYIQLVTRKPEVMKPTPPPKTFYVDTAFGRFYYRKNFATYHIWREIWINCDTKCCRFNKILKLSEVKKKYVTEVNRYRRFVKLHQLFTNQKLSNLAQNRASVMAKYFKLIPDGNQKYDEIIGKVKSTCLNYFIKILFDNEWFENPYFSRVSATRRDFARIMSSNQRSIGIGISKKYDYNFICIKFTPRLWFDIR
uniref:CAP domain-containing protein n=1 Tax=Strongyloides venezuelensis TaxID=75913 RepID=A0A0K0FIY2_STRVS